MWRVNFGRLTWKKERKDLFWGELATLGSSWDVDEYFRVYCTLELCQCWLATLEVVQVRIVDMNEILRTGDLSLPLRKEKSWNSRQNGPRGKLRQVFNQISTNYTQTKKLTGNFLRYKER